SFRPPLKLDYVLIPYFIGLAMSLVRESRTATEAEEKEFRVLLRQADLQTLDQRWKADVQKRRSPTSLPTQLERARQDAERVDSDGTTSDEDGNLLTEDRVLRHRRHLAKMDEEPGMQHAPAFERSSTGERTWSQHRRRYRGLVGHVEEQKRKTDRWRADVAIVVFMTHLYLVGYDACLGQKLIALTVSFLPRLGTGDLSLPRAELAPPLSRQPLTWPTATALAAQLSGGGHLDVGFGVIISFGTYLRPGPMMQLTQGSLIAPTMHIATRWRVLAHRVVPRLVSNVGTQDDTIPWVVQNLEWLQEAFRVLAVGKKNGRLWVFTYPELVREINKAGLMLPASSCWRAGGTSTRNKGVCSKSSQRQKLGNVMRSRA
ncbi:unnamed protein product, partial [Prorocentrum cordatum]